VQPIAPKDLNDAGERAESIVCRLRRAAAHRRDGDHAAQSRWLEEKTDRIRTVAVFELLGNLRTSDMLVK